MTDEQQQQHNYTVITITQKQNDQSRYISCSIFISSIEEADESQTYPDQMYPPGRGILWSRALLHLVSLTFTVRCKVILTFGRMQLSRQLPVRCTPIEASSGQEQ